MAYLFPELQVKIAQNKKGKKKVKKGKKKRVKERKMYKKRARNQKISLTTSRETGKLGCCPNLPLKLQLCSKGDIIMISELINHLVQNTCSVDLARFGFCLK